MEKPIDLITVLTNAIKDCENTAIFNQGKASALKEVISFLSGKTVKVTEHVEEPKGKDKN